MTISKNLLCCPLFDGIAASELTGMLTCLGSRQKSYIKGDVILPEGSPAQEVGILVTGQVHLIRTDYDGNRSIMMHINTGQLFAESFACAKVKRLPVSVVASEDCEVLLLECRRLLTTYHLPEDERMFFENIYKCVSRKSFWGKMESRRDY